MGCGESLSTSDPGRYSRDLDLFLQELEADKQLQEQTIQKQRDAAWKSLERIFKYTACWKSKNYTPAKVEQMKQRRIDLWLGELDQL
jgi:hypothetical protein